MRLFLKLLFSVFLLMQTFFIGIAQNNNKIPVHIARITDNLINPVRMAFNNNKLYVTDNHQKSILKYDDSGNFIGNIPLNFTPVSTTIDKNGYIFIGDADSGDIYKINSNGEISVFYKGCEFPNTMEFSPEGLLYVADSKLHEIAVLDATAKKIQSIGKDILIYPTSFAYDGKNQRILVAEHGGLGTGFTPVCKVWVFDLSGNLITGFGSYGNEDGEFYRITDIGIGKCGNIYVCDSYQGTISIFDENLNFLTKFGTYGNKPGNLNIPLDLAFNSNKDVYISSINNGSIEIFTINDTLPTSDISCPNPVLCPGKQKDIVFSFTGTPPWNFTYTINGNNPVTLTTDVSPYILKVTEPGIYEITQLSDMYSSGTCFSGAAIISDYNTPVSIDISTQTPSICSGDTAIIQFDLSGMPPWNFSYTVNSTKLYQIISEETPYMIHTQETGSYQVSYFSDNYCESEDLGSINIAFSEDAVSDFNFNIKDLDVNFINTSMYAEHYYWDFGDGTSSTEINPVHAYKTNGSYTVNLTASNNDCGENIISKTIDIINVSANEINTTKLLKIYPNPSNGKFTLEINNPDKTDFILEIVSVTGRIVYSDIRKGSKTREQIDLKNISSGIYTVKLKTEKHTETLKLVLNN